MHFCLLFVLKLHSRWRLQLSRQFMYATQGRIEKSGLCTLPLVDALHSDIEDECCPPGNARHTRLPVSERRGDRQGELFSFAAPNQALIPSPDDLADTESERELWMLWKVNDWNMLRF